MSILTIQASDNVLFYHLWSSVKILQTISISDVETWRCCLYDFLSIMLKISNLKTKKVSIQINLTLRPRCKTLKVASWDLDLIDLSTLCCHLHFHLEDTLTQSIVSGATRLLRCNIKEKGNQTTIIPFHLIYFVCNLQDPKRWFLLILWW